MSSDHVIDAATAMKAVEILESPQEIYSSIEETDSAIDALEKVLSATPPGPLRTTILSNLGLTRMARFQLTKSLSDLDSAIARLWEAHKTQAAYETSPALSATIPNLISALHTRAEVTGNWDDLDEAISWGRAAVVRLPPGLTQRAAALASLSSALRIRYERSQYEGDLTEAIDLGRQAAADLPYNHPRLGFVLSNLGSALMAAGLAGESIVTYQQALEQFHTAGNRGGAARTLNNLAGALTQTGRIDEAVTIYQQALKAFHAIEDGRGEERARNNLAAARALAKSTTTEDTEGSVSESQPEEPVQHGREDG